MKTFIAILLLSSFVSCTTHTADPGTLPDSRAHPVGATESPGKKRPAQAEVPDDFAMAYALFHASAATRAKTELKPLVADPLEIRTCEEANCTVRRVAFDEFFAKLDYRPDDFMYLPGFELEGDRVLVHYGYEGAQFTLSFGRINGQWALVQFRTTSD